MGDKSSKGDGAPLKKVDSYQWPSGHLSHLTEGQLGALDKFKKLCKDKGYYDPGDDKTAPTHDDETLLRYLRARKFLPQDAFAQFKDTEDWRRDNQLDTLYDTIDVEEYEQTRRLYPQWTGRRDKRGIPFYVFEVGKIDAKAVSAYSSSKDKKQTSTNTKTPWKMLKLFALYENLCRFVLPLCSALPERPHAETPISQSSNVVDLSAVGFTKIWGLRSHMSDASNLATAHYPETLDRIFVVGAPSFFPTIWQWAQRWFDPITVSKIFILRESEITSTLSKFVDLENIPTKYGGKLDWTFGDMPNLDPMIVNSLRWRENIEEKGHKTLPIGPIKWQYDQDGDLVATAIGSDKGKPRARVIAGLHPESGVARLALSPGRASKQTIFRNIAASTAPVPASEAAASSPSGTAADPKAATAAAAAVAPSPTIPDPASLQNPPSPPTGADTSPAGTFTVAHRDDSTPAPAGRKGTSATRFEQQASTHAHGHVADGTPEVKLDGQGEKQGIMDPHTVGQAPKVHALPAQPQQGEEPGASLVDQAKNMAGQVVDHAGSAMAAVGLATKKKEEEPVGDEGAGQDDPEVDAMEGGKVEEFLRSKTMSKPQA